MWALLANSLEGLKTRFSTRWDSILVLIGGKCGCFCVVGRDSIRKSNVGVGVSRRQPVRSRDGNEAEAFMVFSFVVSAAAFETGDAAFHRVHACEGGAAFAAGVEVFSLESDALQRQIVASGFVRDAQIAGRPGATRGHAAAIVAASGTMLGEKVGKFMTQGSLNFGRRDFDQFGIEGDRLGSPASEAGRRPEPGVPFDGHFEFRATGCSQELAAKFFQKNVAVEVTSGVADWHRSRRREEGADGEERISRS